MTSEVHLTANPKIFVSRAAPVIAALAVLIYAAIPAAADSATAVPAAADPPAANPGGTAQVAQVVTNPVYYPRPYNSPFYNAPVYTPLDVLGMAFGIYNAPVYGGPSEGGWYFGPTGSLSVLQDSDLIKRFEPRTSDTIFSMPRSITGTSTNWASTSSPWLSSSTFGRLNTEGGSKTRVLSSSIGYDVGARAGYRVGDFRFEGEFDYANNSADTLVNPRRIEMSDIIRREDVLHGSTTGMSFLGNVIYDFNMPGLGLSQYGITPHILAGIGAGQISTDLKWGDRTIVNESGWNVAYQLGAGLQYRITPTVSIDLDYRYRGIADVTLRNDFEKINVPYSSHNFLASLTYQLPWGPAAAPPYWAPPPPLTPYTPQQLPPGAYPTQRF